MDDFFYYLEEIIAGIMFIALILGGIFYLPYLMAGINPFAM
jgi:hypothetical protein